MTSVFRLCIKPTLKESTANVISQVSDSLDKVGRDQDWPPKLLYLVNLCVEEIGLNALTHGRQHGLDEFTIEVLSDNDSLSIELSDNGAPFDPINDAPDPDLSIPLEERSVGGLGIYLLKKMVDHMEYERVDDRNHLKLAVRRT